MPELLPRGFADVLLDRMVAALSAFSAEQAALDPSVAYDSVRDQLRPLRKSQARPLVNVYVADIAPETAGSTARASGAETVSVNVDMVVRGNESDESADIAAQARLHYLREQTRAALYRMINADFGFAVGTIARIAKPRYTPLVDDEEKAEDTLAAGRWTVEITYSWTPEDIAGVPLAEISVQTERFSALYQYGA